MPRLLLKVIRIPIRVLRRVRRPAILKHITFSSEAKPRLQNIPLDSTVLELAGEDNAIVQQLNSHQDQIFRSILPEHRVMIKINLNSANPYPASTDPQFLLQIVNLLRERGITRILVADCSSVNDLPTRRVFRKTGIKTLLKGKAKLVGFDDEPWVHVPIAGEYLKQMIIPRSVYEVDRIIYLTNLKSHRHADFSMSIKHAVGFMHPYQRFDLHKIGLQEKTVEISLAVQPDLIILDARKPFITGGPNHGETVRANKVLIGWDLLCVDLAGYQLLYQLRSEANCLDPFTLDPFQMRQFRHARKMLDKGTCL